MPIYISMSTDKTRPTPKPWYLRGTVSRDVVCKCVRCCRCDAISMDLPESEDPVLARCVSIHIFSSLERFLRLNFTGSGKKWSWWSVFDVCKINYIISFVPKTYGNIIMSIIFLPYFYLPHKRAHEGISYRPTTFKKEIVWWFKLLN